MQKYVVIYRTAGEWKKTFVKEAKDSRKFAESKEPGKVVSDVWACDWGTYPAIPFSLYGDGVFGKSIVEGMVMDIRKKMGVTEKSKTKPSKRNKTPLNWGKSTQEKKEVVNAYKVPYAVAVAVRQQPLKTRAILSLEHKK